MIDIPTAIAAPSAWTAYHAENPKTKRKEVERVRRALSMIDQPIPVVRLDSLGKGVNAAVTADYDPDVNTATLTGPREIWVSRQGPAFRSKDPTPLAGTLVHEAAHWDGHHEIGARERQLAFLRQAIAGGWQDRTGEVPRLEKWQEIFRSRPDPEPRVVVPPLYANIR